MKIRFSNLRERWQIPCHGNVMAWVDGADNAIDAYETVKVIADIHKKNPELCQGVQRLARGDVVAAIYGNVVFTSSCLDPYSD